MYYKAAGAVLVLSVSFDVEKHRWPITCYRHGKMRRFDGCSPLSARFCDFFRGVPFGTPWRFL